MDSLAAADIHPVEEETRPAAETQEMVGTPEEAAAYLSAAAMRAGALRPAAAMLGEAHQLAARGVDRPADSHRPRRTQPPAHWPRRILNKTHYSSRVSLQLRVRIHFTDRNARDTTERWIGRSRSRGYADFSLPDSGSCVDG